MRRSRKVIVIAHCLLNLNSKVRGLANFPEQAKRLITFLLDNDIGIIQMPCPEFTLLGEARWGQSKEQYDTPYYRKHCQKIAEHIAEQLEEYLRNSYHICGIIGVYGSPSCGVDFTCSCNRQWGGEISSNNNLKKQLENLRMVNSSGILMEEMQKKLNKRNINIFMMSFPEQIKEDEKNFWNELKKICE